MTAEPLPDDIKEFVLQYIDSIADIEALLLLRRETRQRWDIARVASRLYIAKEDAAAVLARLQARGFVAVDEAGNYSYASMTPERAATVDRVAEFYTKQLIPITNLIHSKPPTSRIQEFADAFKLRKDD